MMRESLTAEVAFIQRPEGGEGANAVNIWRNGVSRVENSQFKDLEVGAGQANSRTASETGAE